MILFNSFIKITFIYPAIDPIKVYNLMIFSIFPKGVQLSPQSILEHIPHPERTLVPLSSNPLILLSLGHRQPLTAFCCYEFALVNVLDGMLPTSQPLPPSRALVSCPVPSIGPGFSSFGITCILGSGTLWGDV